jgi:hypothetical protein
VSGRPYRFRASRRAFEHILKHRDLIWLTQPHKTCKHIGGLSIRLERSPWSFTIVWGSL